MSVSSHSTLLERVAWPASRVGEAMCELARRAGLPVRTTAAIPPSSEASGDELNKWITLSAEQSGIDAEQVFSALDEITTLVAKSAPALIRLSGLNGAPYLAIVKPGRRAVRVLAPDGRLYGLSVSAIANTICRPFEQPVEAEVERLLDRMALSGRSRSRSRSAVLADRLRNARFQGCWLIRLPAGAPIGAQVREAHLGSRLAMLTCGYIAQYILFVASWWLLGRGVLQGQPDRGWLLGWLLLLTSLVPLRVLLTRLQGLVSIAAGASLRRRLLRGAFRIDRQQIRRKGPGQLFGLVMEVAAIESLATTGGLLALFSICEIAMAAVVLRAGAGILTVPLLASWLVVVAVVTWVYFRQRRQWTRDRVNLTEQLLESMLGHRTRLVQERREERHLDEDRRLDGYLDQSRTMDRSNVWLLALVPRGWLVLALAALIPALGPDSSPARIAISVGGILLAYRAFERLVSGLANLAGAAVSAESIVPVARAASSGESLPLPGAVAASRTSAGTTIAEARDVSFRYREGGAAVLDVCSLQIERGSRILLEGPSGSGKTTFASILAGLEQAKSGLVLMGGLDRASLGSAGWRSRVVMAPQPHDNYIVGGSLAFNLLMGRRWPAERADIAEAEEVCRELGLGDLLTRMPAGIHQMVGDTGWQLSQGERVRVFLARALLQRPNLVVLDESFSALDAENVDRAVKCVMKRAPSVLAIAHP